MGQRIGLVASLLILGGCGEVGSKSALHEYCLEQADQLLVFCQSEGEGQADSCTLYPPLPYDKCVKGEFYVPSNQ